MVFVFPPHIQAGIISGTYEVVKNSAGVLLGIARDRATGHFVGSAIGMVTQPLLAIPDSAGVLLGIARDMATDRFVGSVIGMVAEPFPVLFQDASGRLAAPRHC